MVSAWMWAAALVLSSGDPAAAPAAADSSAFETWRVEDALDEEADEGAFVDDAEADPEDRAGGGGRGRGAGPGSRGVLRVESSGARLLRATADGARARVELLLAREAGEPRPIDDAYASLTLAPRPAPGLIFRAGWLEPRVGAELLLGPRRVTAGPPALTRGTAAWFGAPLSSLPARAAAAQRGVAAEFARGALRFGGLAAWTPREARASGAAWWPLLGARHRNADEEARRGRLHERALGFAAQVAPTGAAWRAWAVALLTRTDPRRAPHEGTSAAAESTTAIGTGGPAGEAGVAWSARDGSAAFEGALALDAGGRARGRVVALARGAGSRVGLVVDTEARGFVPPRALRERRPRAHAGLRFEFRGRRPVTLEAHAVVRAPLERPRLWLALAVTPAAGLHLHARHDGEPRGTRLAVRFDGPGPPELRPRAGAETRFDRAGLARRSAWVRAGTGLPGGLVVRVEARLAGGRSGAAWLDDDLSGGRLVRPGRAAARTRFELVRAGPLAPRLAWARTTSPDGHSDEVRLAVHWTAGSRGGRPDDDPDFAPP